MRAKEERATRRERMKARKMEIDVEELGVVFVSFVDSIILI